MTTITPTPARNLHSGQSKLGAPKAFGAAGFTLVELMIGASLGSFILAAVLSTFLFMGRSGANVQNYNDMESQARTALELFAQDVRQASGVVWSDANTVALTVGDLTVTYQYNPTARRFARREVVTATSVVNSTRVLVTGITSFTFSAYSIAIDPATLDVRVLPLATAADRTAANGQTKQLQISLEAARASTTVVAATNTVLSARFVLRNKRSTV
jgi:Tfp pilus assembly protein PilW